MANFYAHIFLFLSDVMEWMTKKRRQRFLDSFNENFNKRFEDQVNKIRDSSEKMSRISVLASQAEVRAIRFNLERLHQDFRLGQEGESREHAEQTRKLEDLERKVSDLKLSIDDTPLQFKQLYMDIKSLLCGQAAEYLESHRTSIGKPCNFKAPKAENY